MPATTTAKPCARDRLLAAADELFYAEGVQTVGIDRIIEHAGVAKASLYNTFGSKDELVRAYLRGRHARSRDRVAAALARHDDPRAKLLAVFESQAKLYADPAYRGCPFYSASAQAQQGSAALEVTEEYRTWLRDLLTDLARQAGVREPAALARQLHLVYDGVGMAGRLGHERGSAQAARSAAAALVDAALA